MKNLVHTGILLLAAVALCGRLPAAPASDPSDFTLILCDADMPWNDARRTRAAAWLADRAPDVAVLTGLRSADAAAVAVFAKQYGHPHVALSADKGRAVAVTSKTPVETVADRAPDAPPFGFLHVRTAGRDVLGLALTPYNVYHRLREAEASADYLLRRKLQKTCVIAGDLETVPPEDIDTLRRSPELLRQFTGETDDRRALAALDITVPAAFLSHYYFDPLPVHVTPDRRLRTPDGTAPIVRTSYILLPEVRYTNFRSASAVHGAAGLFAAAPLTVTLPAPSDAN